MLGWTYWVVPPIRSGGQVPVKSFKFWRQVVVAATLSIYAGKVKNSRLAILLANISKEWWWYLRDTNRGRSELSTGIRWRRRWNSKGQVCSGYTPHQKRRDKDGVSHPASFKNQVLNIQDLILLILNPNKVDFRVLEGVLYTSMQQSSNSSA